MSSGKADIILVEDNDFDAELTIRALDKCKLHCNLVRLKDGAAILDYLFSPEQAKSDGKFSLPKLIIIDLKMPKVNGIQVLQRLKVEESTRMIPVVVLTSSNEESDIQACYKNGVNSYIVKPLDFDKYTNTVSKLSAYWMLQNRSVIGMRHLH